MILQEFDSLTLDSIVKGEEDLLQACSNADADTKFVNYLTSANSLSTAYVGSHLTSSTRQNSRMLWKRFCGRIRVNNP